MKIKFILTAIAFIAFVLCLFNNDAKAQSARPSKVDSLLHRPNIKSTSTDISQQSLFLEVAGPSGITAINYEKRFGANPYSFGLRVGLGLLPVNRNTAINGQVTNNSFIFVSVPVGVNYLIGGNQKYLELGVSATYATARLDQVLNFNDNDNQTSVQANTFFNPTIGYRYQPDEGGFQFRIGYAPLFGKANYIGDCYISFGYSL
jgi:hypothetical protein